MFSLYCRGSTECLVCTVGGPQLKKVGNRCSKLLEVGCRTSKCGIICIINQAFIEIKSFNN